MHVLDITPPFPARLGGQRLREQIVASLLRQRLAAGTRLPTDDELVVQSGLSHATVRRAMRLLERQGWVERRVGQGTFVGGRVLMPVPPARPAAEAGARQVLRVGVVCQRGDYLWMWLDHLILTGLEAVAEAEALSIELLSASSEEWPRLCQRLAQTRPEVVVCIMPLWSKYAVLATAGQLGLPCLTAGMRAPELGLPNVYEDGAQGLQLAVAHLVAHGHRRIGLLLPTVPYRYVFDRRAGYLAALGAAGLPEDPALVLWVDLDQPIDERTARCGQWLQQSRPTAVVCAMSDLTKELGRLREAGVVRIPATLSVVVFDQEPLAVERLGAAPTHVALPLQAMGEWCGRTARALAGGHEVPRPAPLPCTLVPGATVALIPP